jgi:hypothetical protein
MRIKKVRKQIDLPSTEKEIKMQMGEFLQVGCSQQLLRFCMPNEFKHRWHVIGSFIIHNSVLLSWRTWVPYLWPQRMLLCTPSEMQAQFPWLTPSDLTQLRNFLLLLHCIQCSICVFPILGVFDTHGDLWEHNLMYNELSCRVSPTLTMTCLFSIHTAKPIMWWASAVSHRFWAQIVTDAVFRNVHLQDWLSGCT